MNEGKWPLHVILALIFLSILIVVVGNWLYYRVFLPWILGV